ncbi:Maf family protein [Puniceicoccus vermicola]|uniref:dTTP/UTP pyrophosphatase n=1 Tax=Puniceicoccus vermicola TaxID=388746 RepID=A0A7X1B239_9BACT|nr:Maf family protein [Puniceicoccus vermicola]MBC2604112.1 septum formation protein Maf [Puniceicoccus vermicola]
MKDSRLILASASPRRSDLLREAGVSFRIEPAQVEEHEDPVGDPVFIVRHNAELKASEVAGRFPGQSVLGSDTVVALGDRVLGKPKDEDEAFAMLRSLAGQEHQVHTGVCLIGAEGQREVFSVSTRVKFRELSDEDIRAYIRDVPVMDKAGSYALQDQGSRIVESVSGSRSNVIGLPLEEVLEALRRLEV